LWIRVARARRWVYLSGSTGLSLCGIGSGGTSALAVADDAFDRDADDDRSAGEGEIAGARSFPLDGRQDGGESVLQRQEEIVVAGGAEVLSQDSDLAHKGGLIVERAAGVGAVSGAEGFSAFGDAVAFASGLVEVFAFVNHGCPSQGQPVVCSR
ncbi:MAG TPA: hypothetical protein VFU86_22165, partial [Terriglobales bacterium]|nr:hypothetical protein [Terriglobales bacterium]